jgi:hypothetical protein
VAAYDHTSLATSTVSGILSQSAPTIFVGSFYSPAQTNGWQLAIDNVVFRAH